MNKIIQYFVNITAAAFVIKGLFFGFTGFDAYLFTVLVLLQQADSLLEKLVEKLTKTKASLEETTKKVKDMEATVESLRTASSFKKLGQ